LDRSRRSRPSRRTLASSPSASRCPLPPLAILGLHDDDAGLDPDWWPSTLEATFSSPPSRPSSWHVRWRPLLVLAALIAAMALVIVVLTNRSGPDAPNADDRGMAAVAAGDQVPASGPHPVGNPPAASPASVDVRVVPDANRLPLVRRGGDNAHVVSPVTPMPQRPDDPVLRWLPEILAAAGQTGVSPALIAGVIQTESQGDPASTSPHGARGLMQVMPDHLVGQGVREEVWDDPAANILAGAWLLKWNIDQYGTEWDGIAHYFGIGCDGYNCTDGYVGLVLDAKAHYAPLLTDA
jgi:hypothetical protein